MNKTIDLHSGVPVDSQRYMQGTKKTNNNNICMVNKQ